MNLKPRFDWYAFNTQTVAGIPVFTREIPTSQVVQIIAQFEVGMHDDPSGKEGITHFLEHHTSKRSPLIPTAKARREFSEQHTNDTLNACTGTVFVRFECSCLPERVSFVTERLFDLFCNPLYEDHEKERGTILGEIREKQWENPLVEAKVKERRVHLFGSNHRASRISRALGWSDTVEGITTDDLRMWHRKWFTQPHLSLFLSGAIGENTITDLVQGIALVPTGVPQTHNYPSLVFPHVPSIKERTIHASDIGRSNTDRSKITLTGILPPGSKMDACAPILQNVIRKLILEKLRGDEGACYRVTVDSVPRPFGHETSVWVLVRQEKLVQIEQVILETLRGISMGRYRDEITNSIRVVRNRTCLVERTSSSVVSFGSASFAQYRRIISLSEMIEEMSTITPENIEEIVRNYFTEPYLYIDRLVP